MKTLLTLCIVAIAVSGCSTNMTLSLSGEGYYPGMRTKDGGSFGDPHKSRGQAMRTTMNSNRNNDGKSLYYDKLNNFFKPTQGAK